MDVRRESPIQPGTATRVIWSVVLGWLAFAGVFYSTSLQFRGVQINFPWSLILPLLVSLAWGPVYGLISIGPGLVVLYPFVLGFYNGWASLVPVLSLFLWIGIHGYGSLRRRELEASGSAEGFWNIYILQLGYSGIRLLLYLLLFSPLISLNPPWWNPGALTSIGTSIVLLFALKGILVETVFVAFCDVLLLLPPVRHRFKLPVSPAARLNTRILLLFVVSGLVFALLVLSIHVVIIDQQSLVRWLGAPDEKNRITLIMALILFTLMGGVSVRFVERLLAAQDALRRRERDLETLNEQLEDRVEARTWELRSAVGELEDFTHTISHDLKSPLRAIEAYTEILWEDFGSRLDSGGEELVEGIRTTCQGMNSLIERLLEYATTARQQVVREPVETGALLRLVEEEFVRAFPRRNIRVHYQEEYPVVELDPVLFVQLLRNLFSNGVKFTPEDRDVHLSIGCHRIQDAWEFSFRDEGVGFDMQDAHKAFLLFQRMHHPERFEGYGIGLATVRKIIERHGGTIRIASEPGKGTTVWFSFPSHPGEVR